ncbi:MAG: glycosyltransferase family 4 protein, partial [Acidobacteriota bacterium]
ARHNELAALAMARVVITNSESARQQVIEKLGLPPNRVRAIYYGADACAFRPPTPEEKQRARRHFQWSADQPLAIFIGALGHDRNKGFDLLFAAWEQLCQQGKWDVNLVAFGGGAEVELWREQASQKGLASRVKMMGFSKEIATALTGADILISPSHYEAYGLGVQEALCCGLPALVTRTAGVAEHYPPELHNLLLNDPPQVEDLVTRLRQWRGNMAEERCRVAQLSRTLRQRSWSDMAREIVEVIDRQ